jgi:methylene-tetrahydromethanopterin dehydrogenase
MEKLFILHMFTPTPNASPFDINMAYDAGYDVVATYVGVTMEHITALTQDAIFSRGPSGVKRTGIFIGGREIGLAADMIDAARRSMVPPFEVSVFADPSGAFTTAAAMVAAVERELKRVHNTDLKGKNVAVLGGTGPVGTAAAVLASDAGAKVRIASHTSAARARMVSEVCNARYGASTQPAESSSADKVASLMDETEVVLACAKAGVQVMSKKQVEEAKNLLVAADVNAVPPAGIEGLGVHDSGKRLDADTKAVGIGALAVGDVKYQVQRKLFEQMLDSQKPLYLDFRDAFAVARQHVA